MVNVFDEKPVLSLVLTDAYLLMRVLHVFCMIYFLILGRTLVFHVNVVKIQLLNIPVGSITLLWSSN